MIQVNDKGEDNDNDKYHVAYCWVNVKLRDINDNKPMFDKVRLICITNVPRRRRGGGVLICIFTSQMLGESEMSRNLCG